MMKKTSQMNISMKNIIGKKSIKMQKKQLIILLIHILKKKRILPVNLYNEI